MFFFLENVQYAFYERKISFYWYNRGYILDKKLVFGIGLISSIKTNNDCRYIGQVWSTNEMCYDELTLIVTWRLMLAWTET